VWVVALHSNKVALHAQRLTFVPRGGLRRFLQDPGVQGAHASYIPCNASVYIMNTRSSLDNFLQPATFAEGGPRLLHRGDRH
jgi:hypothetical protein